MKEGERGRVTRWLLGGPPWVSVLFAVFASFSTYFCMYAFRKPFLAGKYEGLALSHCLLGVPPVPHAIREDRSRA